MSANEYVNPFGEWGDKRGAVSAGAAPIMILALTVLPPEKA
jgi:hypothetical protein